jgi:hypothetical protein
MLRLQPSTVRGSLTGTQEIDELVEDWTPEPLAAPVTAFEEAENEKRPVIVGCATLLHITQSKSKTLIHNTVLRHPSPN